MVIMKKKITMIIIIKRTGFKQVKNIYNIKMLNININVIVFTNINIFIAESL